LQGSWTGSASQSNRLAVMMLTGDNEASAQRIARKLGIRNVSAALRWAQALAGSSCMLGRAENNSCAG
jgi:magnesium-transporting ATPase (P-type)